jgi:transcriptional regulator of acetoin/glycerol metabolism
MRGTNALGTALATAKPMLINRGEHFLERLGEYSCSSVLLNDPQGQVCGALSLARKGSLAASKDSVLLLAMTASYIDRRLFISSQFQDITLAFHTNKNHLDSPWQGLLSVSLDGLIVAANDSACELLNQPRQTLLERAVFL